MNLKNTALEPYEIHRLRDEFVSGDDNAYSIIYKLFSKDLYSYGLSFRVKNELIEDAIHDIFVEIYTHRYNLAKVENLKFYFMASFRNRLFYLIRKEPNNVEVTDQNLNFANEADIQELWINREVLSEKENLVKYLFSELNEHQREALHHRFVEGFSCEEVAELMNINYQSAKNLIHRAINKLRKIGRIVIMLIVMMVYQF
ncbi:MAG: sigma-70 family RNA polymerase sigma factor [Paludibacter sp.]|nr:sigma-70 family RNA polymerase sigma factor [Paludibacter sp.]